MQHGAMQKTGLGSYPPTNSFEELELPFEEPFGSPWFPTFRNCGPD